MPEAPTPAYGTTRGPAVSYLEVERAAIAILKAGQRPSVERVRSALGRGSPQTLLSALNRFWRDLGTRVEADPAALTRLPVEIVELVDGIWQRSLALASQAAKHEDNAARERLSRIQSENAIRATAFALREKEFETTARARERALTDAQEHVRTLMSLLETDRLTLRARETRIGALEAEVESYRRQLATVVARAVTRNRVATERRRAVPPRAKGNPRRSGPRKHPAARPPQKRSKRRSPR
jgi:Plasmid replication region DNA-binding N-term